MRILVLFLGLFVTACWSQTPVPYTNFGTEKGPGSVGVHTVMPGDTLYKVSKSYRLPMRDIITVNKLEAPYVLNVGYRMKLPPPNEYRVREGDSVSTIARMHEVSVSRLVQANNLSSPYIVQPGQVLRLPTSYRLAAPKPDYPPSRPDMSPDTPSQKPAYSRKASATKPPPKKVPRSSTPKMAGNGQFMRPVEGNIISSYGPKKDGLYNDGINIAAVKGAPVRAAQNGVVVYTGDDLEGYGNLILVRHQNRMMTAYAHMDKVLIKRGDKVTRGQSIGTVGKSGQVDRPQLHFEIRRGTKSLDPTKYL